MPIAHSTSVQASDPEGFSAERGPRTAERRSERYNFSCDHPCTWNGPSWPYETSRLLTGLGSAILDYPQHVRPGHLACSSEEFEVSLQCSVLSASV